MKANKAVFLDRDGTIIKDKGYLNKVSGVEFYKDTIESLKKLENLGFILIGISNQSGIGMGIATRKQVDAINSAVIKRLKNRGISLKKIYYCPHLPIKNCSCRKPKISLVKKAEKKYNINLKKSFVLGDKLSDVRLGYNSGAFPILLLTGMGKRSLQKIKNINFSKANNLTQAVRLIQSMALKF
ncbi:MAG: HAD family hydrolase [bacterium]